ncbi:MAG: hypothetical protein WBQ20_01935 [Methyloceanibacter sp.]
MILISSLGQKRTRAYWVRPSEKQGSAGFLWHTLVAICKDEKAPQSARVSAAIALLGRAYGEAPTFSTTDPTTFKRAVDLSDDELAAIVTKERR